MYYWSLKPRERFSADILHRFVLIKGETKTAACLVRKYFDRTTVRVISVISIINPALMNSIFLREYPM